MFRCRDLKDIYGWCGIEAYPRALKKAMWQEIMMKFNCKALVGL